MALTLPATGGTGTAIPFVATEIVASDHFQRVKLVDPTLGSSAYFGSSGFPMYMVGSLSGGAIDIEGDTGHGSLDTGNPVKVGGFSVGSTWPTAVLSGAQRVNAIFDRFGRQVVAPYAPAGMNQHRSADYSTVQSGTAVWTPAAGLRINLTSLRMTVGSGTPSVITVFFARSGAAIGYVAGSGVAAMRGEFAPSATVKPGVISNWTYPLVGDPNDVLRIQSTAAAQIYLMVDGFES